MERKLYETQACHSSVGVNNIGRSGVPDQPGLQKLWFKKDRQTSIGAQLVEDFPRVDSISAPYKYALTSRQKERLALVA